MENNLERSTRLLEMLHKKFFECQDSLTIVMEYWDKKIVHIVHLGEKVIPMDS
jgi:hypothetical protein